MEENKKDEEKVGFTTEQEARDELIRIVSTNYNTCKSRKPSRVYLSPITGLYHLTSSPNIKIY
jgi:hypothetical protein